jgi:D-aspartate ligase
MANRPQALEEIHDESDVPGRLQPVVVGGDILGYTYARSFHELYGIRTIVLSGINVRVTSSSRFVDYRVLDGMADEDALVSHLASLGRGLAAAGKVGLLLGSADWHARVISSHKEELSEWYVVPYVDFDLLDEITQKERFYALCEELGIDYPKTWYLDCADADAEPDYDSFPYPLVAKPSNSAAYDNLDFPGKHKVYEISSPDELRSAFEAVRAGGYRHRLIVQDFVPGADDAIRSLTTFSDANGEMRLVSGGRVALQDHSPVRLGNPVTIVSERVDAIVDAAARFLRRTGYRGYANFDIKYDSRDGTYRFFEVNARAGRNTYYVTLGGMNMARPVVLDWVLGQEIPYTEAYDEFVYTLVPPSVVRRSVADDALRERVLAMYRSGRARSPLDYAPDSFEHKLWWRLYYRHQVHNFRKYLWDVEK